MAGGGEPLAALEQQLQRLRVEAARQQEAARAQRQQQAAAGGADEAAAALAELRRRIGRLEEEIRRQKGGDSLSPFQKNKQQCENLIKRKFFVVPAYEIYGGVGGLYDFGPPGCGLKCAVEAAWRSHFVLEEDMLEVSGPCLTPHVVLKTSGHVDRFTDFMVKDVQTQECFRADKYLEEVIEKEIAKMEKEGAPASAIEELKRISRQADAYSADELHALLQRFHAKSPSGNELSPPFPFNLMFALKIGPKEEAAAAPLTQQQQQQQQKQQQQEQEGRGYLRPETAQGIFVNFRRLYEFVGGRLPFAAAQIGLGYRNEIAPRNGLLRVREFQMAEIEHFCHPEKKNEFPKFAHVEHLVLPLFPREAQLGSGALLLDTSLGEAVAAGIIANKTLAYYLARTYLFLQKVGIKTDGHVRFRQHLKTEMAHYATDCWDAEVETAYGWIEVAGHADRAGELAASSCSLSPRCFCSPLLRLLLALEVYTQLLAAKALATQCPLLILLMLKRARVHACMHSCCVGGQQYACRSLFGCLAGWLALCLSVCLYPSFDLSNHSKASHVDLVAMERFDPPLRVSFLKPVFNKQLLGSTFKQQQADVIKAIEALTDQQKEALEAALEQTGRCTLQLTTSSSSSSSSCELTRPMVSFQPATKTVGERPFVPSVIEPSFGIGRILHCIMEHAFVSRGMQDQEDRVYMRFTPLVAPTKVVLLPLSNQEAFNPMLQQLKSLCVQQQLSNKTDSSGASVGRRYARADELGIPFALTVDFLSLEDQQVTLRERDCMQQVRLPLEEAPRVVAQLCRGDTSWDRVCGTYPVIQQQPANGA
ncbi:hypothetical protein Efla_001963 [Eimeria flavescens]